MARKKKTEVQEQVNGQVEGYKPSTLDQIWGDTGISRYNTLDETVYKKTLDEMNKSDLQSHARKMGIFPSDDREILNRKLLKEFRLFVSMYKVPPPKIDTKQPSAEALKILSEGR